MKLNPIERLRQIWTPESEVEELFQDLSPQTELDSMTRDFLSRIMEQRLHTVTLDLDKMNTGNIRWEIISTLSGSRQVTIWHEPEGT